MRATLVGCVVALVLGPQPASTWPPDLGHRDAELTRVFTPRAMPQGMYEAYRSGESIAAIAKRLRGLDAAPLEQAWQVQRANVVEAFGLAAPYDRGRVARLYLGRRLEVARGAVRRERDVTAFTLISPYPDPTLSKLEPGTLVIVFNVPPE